MWYYLYMFKSWVGRRRAVRDSYSRIETVEIKGITLVNDKATIELDISWSEPAYCFFRVHYQQRYNITHPFKVVPMRYQS